MLILIGAAAVATMAQDTSIAASNAVPVPGTITIASATGAALPAAFDDAVRQAMLNARFTPLPGQGHGLYAATIAVTQKSSGVVTAGSRPAPPPLATLTGGVSLSMPAGGGRLSDLVVTELKVTITRRSDAQPVWSGSAVTARVTGTAAGATDIVAKTLADAVLAQFPHQAAGPISIP
ncbi:MULTISPECIES: hypothetical protein [unclassified Sphingomonas]|uniref:hypothetical protein n=1 Tax=unclassified Sphingomonas TaxID=196159 RepID=UPI00226A87DC|nr:MULTISPECIES: hypothetical protein [unclassified Sphingomonas]